MNRRSFFASVLLPFLPKPKPVGLELYRDTLNEYVNRRIMQHAFESAVVRATGFYRPLRVQFEQIQRQGLEDLTIVNSTRVCSVRT